MKKFLMLAVIALSSIAANAQIGSTTSRSVTTHKSDVFLSRIQMGYNAQRWAYKAKASGVPGASTAKEATFGHGLDMGYLANIRILKNQPLYAYTGMLFAFDITPDDNNVTGCHTAHLGMELPFGAAYRLRLGSSNIHLSPYAGFHIKANLLWGDFYRDSYDDPVFDNWYDFDGSKRAQFGAQFGCTIDLGVFYFGMEFNGDFNKAYKETEKVYGAKFKETIGTCGFRMNMGFVF